MRAPGEQVIVKKAFEPYWHIGRDAGEGGKGGRQGMLKSRRENKRVMWRKLRQGVSGRG